ncbi:class I adenylate-forming enzyme family protein [Methylophaga frappieri]|nr:class I adenylate-forming enzyme family protein [Methylophaga frappieri]
MSLNFSLEDSQRFVTEVLDHYAITQPDTIAIENDNLAISYQKLKQLVNDWQQALEQANLPKGLCIGLRFHSQIGHLICHLALLKQNITQVIIDPHDPVQLQQNTVMTLAIDLILQETAENQQQLGCAIHSIESLPDSPQFQVSAKPYSQDSVLVFSGSGTTSSPKHFAFTSTQYAAMLKRGLDAWVIKNQERYFCYSRLNFVFPQRQALLCLSVGACLVLSAKPIPDLIQFVRKRQVEHLLLTANQAQQFILNSPSLKTPTEDLVLPHLKSLQLSSSLIKQRLRSTIMAKVTQQLYILYGANEFGIISMAYPEQVANQPGTVGEVLPNVTVQIMHDGEKTSQPGAIRVTGANMIQGYVADPTASQKSFPDGECYLPNDTGFFTADGQLIIEGRSDDAILYTGVNLYPRALEEVLEAHPAVTEAAVFPISLPDQDDIPVAAVEVNQPIEVKLLLSFCQNQLGWKRPQHIFIIDQLPRNRAGKVLKRQLKEMVESKIRVRS